LVGHDERVLCFGAYRALPDLWIGCWPISISAKRLCRAGCRILPAWWTMVQEITTRTRRCAKPAIEASASTPRRWFRILEHHAQARHAREVDRREPGSLHAGFNSGAFILAKSRQKQRSPPTASTTCAGMSSCSSSTHAEDALARLSHLGFAGN